jgi:putative ABC transport system ATP-binding protein
MRIRGHHGPVRPREVTLVNLIGCLDTPTAGGYRLNGHPVKVGDDELAHRNREIGFSSRPLACSRTNAMAQVGCRSSRASKERRERGRRSSRVGLWIARHNPNSSRAGSGGVSRLPARCHDPSLLRRQAREPGLADRRDISTLPHNGRAGNAIVLVTHGEDMRPTQAHHPIRDGRSPDDRPGDSSFGPRRWRRPARGAGSRGDAYGGPAHPPRAGLRC